MSNFNKNDLLPEGFKVFLPEDAEKEEYISRKFQDMFSVNGYLLVKTPLIEYEYNEKKYLIQNKANNSFFLMEPETKKILVLRSDITSQVAKLATSKMASYERPLRLMYSGEVLRNEKNVYQTDRQFKQIGAEVIGASSLESFVEILNITLDALNKIRVKNITIDFSLPSISRYLEKIIDFKKPAGQNVKQAIDNKDSSVINYGNHKFVKDLINLSGTIEEAKKNAYRTKFPKQIEIMLNNFFKLSSRVRKHFPSLSMTVDITEAKSFLNYENFGFKIYNKENANAIAIGGDYKINNRELGLGVTIMINKLIESININKQKRIYIPFNIDTKTIPKIIKKNSILIRELFPRKNSLTESKKHNCNYIFKKDGKLFRVQ